MEKVSVVMATHNEGDGKQLKQAIESVLAQTYTNLELVICDDGSTDSTSKILEKIALSEDRIKIICNKENHKAGYARNTAICASTGKYIAIMDSDDVMHKDRLKKQVEFLENNPQYAFVGTKGEFFINKIGDDGEHYWFCEKPKPKDFLFSLPFVHASIMFRKEALEKVGGYDISKYAVRAEDYDLLLRLYGAGYKGKNLNEVLYYIRRDEAQYQRRKYRYRFHEAYIKFRGFKKLGLMPKGIFYAIKPLIVGLIPIKLMAVIQKKYYAKK